MSKAHPDTALLYLKKYFFYYLVKTMPLRKTNFSLPAINETSAGFSPRAGFPILKFQIGAQDGLLETSSLRLVGRLQIKETSAQVVDPGQVDFDNIAVEAGTPGDMQPCTKATMAPFGGVHTLVDKTVILSKKTSKELSTVTNYSQYESLREARFGTKTDFRNSLPSRSLSLGQNAKAAQRRFMISSGDDNVKAQDQGQEFSIKLDVPMLQGELLHLGEDFLGGLMMSIHLSPESAFFSTFQNGAATPAVAAIAIDTYRYVLQSVRLEGRIQVPTGAELKAYDPVFPMDNQVNLLQDIHSSSSSGTLNPQVSMVKGMVNLFLLQSQTNSLDQSQFSYSMPPGLKSQTQAKDSVRFPLKYPVESKPSVATSGSASIANLVYKSLQTNIGESRVQFERALADGRLPAYTSADIVLTEQAEAERAKSIAAPLTSTSLLVDSVGIGSDYTLGLGMAQSYVGSNYNLVLESGVQSGDAKLLGTYNNSPLLQQSFVRNRAFFDTKTLVKTM